MSKRTSVLEKTCARQFPISTYFCLQFHHIMLDEGFTFLIIIKMTFWLFNCSQFFILLTSYCFKFLFFRDSLTISFNFLKILCVWLKLYYINILPLKFSLIRELINFQTIFINYGSFFNLSRAIRVTIIISNIEKFSQI